MITTPSRFAALTEGARGSAENPGCEEDSSLHGATAPSTSVHFVLPKKADSAESTPALLTDVHATVVDQPNRWYVEDQYQIYRDANFLNDKGSRLRL